MFLAIYLGIAAATAQTEVILWVVGISTVILLFAMERDVWMLIPFSLLSGISLMAFPGSFSLDILCQIAFVGFFFLLILTRRVRLSFKFGWSETLALLVLGTVVQAYVRNPVGLNIFGSSSVGARPYFTFAIAFVVALFFAGSWATIKKFRTAVLLTLLGGILTTAVHILAYIPGLQYYAAVYLGAGSYNVFADPNTPMDTAVASRNTAAVHFSRLTSRWLVSRINPLKALIHPFWLVIMLLTMAAAAYSGFRNSVVFACLMLALGVYYWNGLKAVIACSIMAVVGLGCIATLNSVIPLPANIQRSLSFLPGTWEHRHIEDAEGSTEWRLEIWKEALTSERWIQNKLFGDGLGFTKQELELQEAYRMRTSFEMGASGFDLMRENILINGDYHSGPVSFIRTTGYIGLFAFLCALFHQAFRAHRLLRTTRNTEWFRIVAFFCIPMIIHPVFFLFIFGAFNIDSSLFLIHAGLLRLLENSVAKDSVPSSPDVHKALPG